MLEIQVGHKFWWIAGYCLEGLIAIYVTVDEIEDTWRKKDPSNDLNWKALDTA